MATVLVLGAGIIGVAAALELQARGYDVTLLDRKAPGQETSYGNAGVFARSSLVPLNNPALWGRLPQLLTNRTASLRFSVPYVLKNLKWAMQFLRNARLDEFQKTAKALNDLITLSASENKRLLTEAGAEHRLSDDGWLYLYRDADSYAGTAQTRDTFEAFGVETEHLKNGAIQELEPALNAIYSDAIWFKDTSSVNNPGAVVQDYVRLYVSRGGKVEKAEIAALLPSESAWKVQANDGREFEADQVVVAMGPWSNDLLKPLGADVPMAFERGYHRHFEGAAETASNASLARPIYDTGAGFVLAPMEQGLRLSTGVELNDRDAPKNPAQLALAERSAREAIDLGTPVEKEPWVGSRPTLPDSRPVIGEAVGLQGLYLAFGHQHIGFGTGTGTAQILADLMQNKPPPIDAMPFAHDRF